MYFLPKQRLIKLSILSSKGVLIVCSLFSPIALAVCITATAPATTPSSNFTDHNDGTVTHKATGLMWKVCSEGQAWGAGACSDTPTTHNWQQALQIPEALNLGGGFPSSENYTNWRLPNINELTSIVELQCYDPAINATIFPNTVSSWYWSSSPNDDDNSAWGVNFYDGYGNDSFRLLSYQVRLVRSK